MIYILKCILFVFQTQLIEALPNPKWTEYQTSVPSTRSLPPKPKSDSVGVSEAKPISTVANFYGQGVKPSGQSLDKKASKSLDSGTAVSVKRPPVCVRGKCVTHSEERFRVEVGYNAELITVFKNIPSRNYGELCAPSVIIFTILNGSAFMSCTKCFLKKSWTLYWQLVVICSLDKSLRNCQFCCRSCHKDVELQPWAL